MRSMLAVFLFLCLFIYAGISISYEIKFKDKDYEMELRPQGKLRFSEASWRVAGSRGASRYEMSDDLVLSRILIGMTRSDVIRVLGESDLGQRSNRPEPKDSALMYYLAKQSEFPGRSIFLPSSWFGNRDLWILGVVLKDGKVVDVKISRS